MTNPSSQASVDKPHVGLFVTCLVDLMRPVVGFAAVDLIEKSGCRVSVPERQTCCGQPAYNSGDRAGTKRLARQVIAAFEEFDYVVAPSGSCAGMLKVHYAELFADEPGMAGTVKSFCDKTFELISFLVDVRGMTEVATAFRKKVTYHDSCAGLRELGIQAQPRALLKSVTGLEISEMNEPDVCCGFGGTFCVKYGDISNAIVEKKTANIDAAGAEVLLAGDLGCLMNMAGKLSREGRSVEVRHVSEVLAGMTDTPAIVAKRS
jgi:L-lactate dehydrogenase complex protein LldE